MVVGSGVPIVDATHKGKEAANPTKQGAGVPEMGGPVGRFLCPWMLGIDCSAALGWKLELGS